MLANPLNQFCVDHSMTLSRPKTPQRPESEWPSLPPQSRARKARFPVAGYAEENRTSQCERPSLGGVLFKT